MLGHNNQLAAKECYDAHPYNVNCIPHKMNIIIYEIYYVKEAAKETLPEGKHVTFLQGSMPLDTRLAGSQLSALWEIRACPRLLIIHNIVTYMYLQHCLGILANLVTENTYLNKT